MQGRAEVTTGDMDSISSEIRRITRRYVTGESEVEAYIQRWDNLRTIVTIRPAKVRAWGVGY